MILPQRMTHSSEWRDFTLFSPKMIDMVVSLCILRKFHAIPNLKMAISSALANDKYIPSNINIC